MDANTEKKITFYFNFKEKSWKVNLLFTFLHQGIGGQESVPGNIQLWRFYYYIWSSFYYVSCFFSFSRWRFVLLLMLLLLLLLQLLLLLSLLQVESLKFPVNVVRLLKPACPGPVGLTSTCWVLMYELLLSMTQTNNSYIFMPQHWNRVIIVFHINILLVPDRDSLGSLCNFYMAIKKNSLRKPFWPKVCVIWIWGHFKKFLQTMVKD